MNRRQLLKTTLFSGAILTMGSGCESNTSAKDQAKNLEPGSIIGHGAYTYKVQKDWVKGNSLLVDHCHEMVMDKNGRLIMTTTHVKNNIIIFDKSGNVLDTWTGNWPEAHGLSLKDEGGEEFLYITDPSKNMWIKTDLKGNIIKEMSYPKEIGIYDNASEFKPTETAIADNGCLLYTSPSPRDATLSRMPSSA